MGWTGYELLWLFFAYAFAGWMIGTAGAAVRQKKFVDVGFLYGPWCPAYGFGGLAFAVFLTELHDNLFFLFVGGTILSFVVTYTTGFVLERIFHRKWWDVSRKRFQFSGYVSLPWSVVWGLLGVLCIRFVNPFLRDVLKLLPHGVGKIILLVGKNQCLRIVRGTIQQMSIIIRCDYLIVYGQLGKYYRWHGIIL